MKQRITYLDVARGMAMLLVIFYHVPLYIRMCHPGAAELLAPHISAGTYILPFFMPVFFVISGFFTNTAKSYGQFLWGDIKNLLLVGLLLQFVNILIQTVGLQDMGILDWFVSTLFSDQCLDITFSQWFISAIFFARQIYYGIDRLAHYIAKDRKGLYWFIELGLLADIAVAGILLEPYAPHNSQWFYCQGLVFALFIAFGRMLHDFEIPNSWLFVAGAHFIPLMVIARLTGLSTLEYGMVNTAFSLGHWPFYLLLALSGSALIIAIARFINRFAPLEFVGRHTLIFYIPQGGILLVTATLLGKLFPPDSTVRVWLYILVLWLAALCGLTLIVLVKEAGVRLISYLLARSKTQEP